MLDHVAQFKCGHPRTPGNTKLVDVYYKRDQHPICLACYRRRNRIHSGQLYANPVYRERKLAKRAEKRRSAHYVAGITAALITGG